MDEQIVKKFENGVLVNFKKLNKKIKKPKYDDLLRLADSVKATYKQYECTTDSLIKEVYELRRKVIKLERLLNLRVTERDSAKVAHRLRLEQVKELEEMCFDLMNEIENDDEDDEDNVTISLKKVEPDVDTKPIDIEDRPRFVNANPVSRSDS